MQYKNYWSRCYSVLNLRRSLNQQKLLSYIIKIVDKQAVLNLKYLYFSQNTVFIYYLIYMFQRKTLPKTFTKEKFCAFCTIYKLSIISVPRETNSTLLKCKTIYYHHTFQTFFKILHLSFAIQEANFRTFSHQAVTSGRRMI